MKYELKKGEKKNSTVTLEKKIFRKERDIIKMNFLHGHYEMIKMNFFHGHYEIIKINFLHGHSE